MTKVSGRIRKVGGTKGQRVISRARKLRGVISVSTPAQWYRFR